ncbi:MAG: cell surface protein, partial [Ottowia sp.]|nr:cell surface protein [Ottowia sp.]
MKKSIVALGAALVAGAAHAVIVQPITNDAVATQMAPVEAGGIGHVLVTPYFSTANGNTTLLSVVNTDSVNGKAVKVRFRGAANSDDILDFTVLMSPADVWTASVERGPDGISRIIANDTTCVLPWQLVEGNDNSFRTSRLDQARSAEALAMHTQEGYVEYLNMADILPGTPVFAATKHVKNVAPCTQAVMDTLMNTVGITKGEANALGLGNPTGGLFGNWSIFNNANITSYGGGHASVAAVDAAGARADARLFFSPQTDAMADTPNVVFNTADPLLNVPAGATVPAVDPLWLDLPDLST